MKEPLTRGQSASEVWIMSEQCEAHRWGGWFHELSEQPIPDTLKVDAPKEALGTGNDGDHQDARPEGQGDWGVGRLSPSHS